MTIDYTLYDSLTQPEGKPYKKFPYDVDFGELAASDMLRYLGCADIFHITCGEYSYWDVKLYLDKLSQKVPFYPVINLSMSKELKKHEWYITAIRFDRHETR